MANLITVPGSRPADEGEALVVSFLRDKLPGTYTLIPNFEIAERGRPAFEYDLAVVAPHAVYIVEVKRWQGGITGDDDTWVVGGRNRRPNPWPTTNNKARVIKSLLVRQVPSGDSVWVEAVIAIAADLGELDLRGNCRDHAFRYTDLPAFLTNPAALAGKAGDVRAVRGYVEQAILKVAHARPQNPKRFGSYEVVETLSRRDTVGEYLVRNTLLPAGPPVRLRVFSYDPYLPKAETEHRLDLIRREAEALQRIGTHPNLIALRGFDTVPEDPNLFIEATDWSNEGTLRVLMSRDATMSLERKLELAQGIAAGLKAVHEAGVIHRDVRPENILIGTDGQPRLMNFDHARLTIPQAHTISPLTYDPDVPRAYMAPELLNPVTPATQATDLYGLGVILFEMLVGEPLYKSPEEALKGDTSAGGPISFGVANIPQELNDLICTLIQPDAHQRPQEAGQVLDDLRVIREKTSESLMPLDREKQVSPEVDERTGEPDVFSLGEMIDDKYQVQQILQEGGSGQVYKVFDEIRNRTYALKVFKETSLSLDFLKKEIQALDAISHPNIVQVRGWGRLLRSGRFYLVSDYADGEDLKNYVSPEHHLPAGEAVKAICDLLRALETIHPNVDRIDELRSKGVLTEEEHVELQQLKEEGWLHRDIKPSNLMLTAKGLVLIDFNIAARASEAHKTFAGTPGYMLPDVGIVPWSTDADLFATGIVLYELVTGHHPYPNRQPNAEDPPADPCRYLPDISPAFATILLKAVSCDSNHRYHSARRFRLDLDALDGIYFVATSSPEATLLTLEPWEQIKPNYNPYVTRFLRFYSQAQRDNSGTRGLDDVARLTYVNSRLDTHLRPSVLDGQYCLVIITGNAGDGKTAFIQNMEATVKESGELVQHPTPNSSAFYYRGVHFITNYDGSQDEGADRANDQVLTEFFAPFADDGFDRTPINQGTRTVHVIAINEGRLVDFFSEPDSASVREMISNWPFRRMGKLIRNFFDPDATKQPLPNWMLIVDLNQRSVIAADAQNEYQSLLDIQLMRLLRPEFWAPCQRCQLSNMCFIKYNVDSFADPVSGTVARERLRTLFEIVHLRRRLHITMRDMRSALSWLLFRDQNCDDVARVLSSQSGGEQAPAQGLDLLYFNAFASDGQSPQGRRDDRLVALLREIDPAQVTNPQPDRALHFHTAGDLLVPSDSSSTDEAYALSFHGAEGIPMLAFEHRSSLARTWFEGWRIAGGWEIGQDQEKLGEHQKRHRVARRILFFERRDDGWTAMLPYQYLDTFRKTVASPENAPAMVQGAVIHGISLAEGAHNHELSTHYVCLRAGNTAKVPMKSFRLFPARDFQIEVPIVTAEPFLEHAPDRILFYYAPADVSERLRGARRAELTISLDLLEMLMQIGDGFAPSWDEVGGVFINLLSFKNALAHLPYRHVVLTRDGRSFFEAVIENHSIITLRPWAGE